MKRLIVLSFDSLIVKGGPGSGFHDHAGRPGEVGGSSSQKRAGSVRTAEEIQTYQQLVDFSETAKKIPLEMDGKSIFTHAVRYPSMIDSILRDGIQPKGEWVFASRGLVRDLNAGYVVFWEDLTNALEGLDVIEPGLSYQEFRFRESILPEKIVKVVRSVRASGGFFINEDELAKYAVDHQGIDRNEITDLPDRYAKWFYLQDKQVNKGGPGSGNFDHAGRPGKRGGSAPAETVQVEQSKHDAKSYEQTLRDVEVGLRGKSDIEHGFIIDPSTGEIVFEKTGIAIDGVHRIEFDTDEMETK